MKQLVVFVLILSLLCSFIACTSPRPSGADPTKEPEALNTEATASEAPTEAPTAEPTVEPTEEPTAEPTNQPETQELSFDNCAEELLRLTPYKAYNGPLPEDAADDQVLYLYNSGGEATELGPLLFAADGGITLVCDYEGGCCRGVFMYDADGKCIHRTSMAIDGIRYGALADRTLYTIEGAYDTDTGELNEGYAALSDYDDFVCGMLWTGTIPKLIVCGSVMDAERYTLSYDYYELNENNWIKSSNICTMVEDDYGEYTEITLPNGVQHTFNGVGYNVLGTDAAGNYYFIRLYYTWTVMKLSPEGFVLSEMEIPFSINDLWDPEMMIRLSQDGTIYVAAALPDYFSIWKVAM